MKISVVIPCFKSGNYVLEAVGSVLTQKGDHNLLEIIVIDDHNDDDETLGALNKLKKDYSNMVRVLQNLGDKGPGASRNVGILHAKGDWIAFLDADDRYTDNALATLCETAIKYPDCGWVGGDFSIWNPDKGFVEDGFFNNRPITKRILEVAYQNSSPLLLKRPVKQFIETALTNTISNIVKKELLDKIGGFDNSLRLQQDYNLYLKIASLSDFVFVPVVCALYRQHDTNSTKSYLSTLEWRIVALKKILRFQEFKEYKCSIYQKISIIFFDISYRHKKNRNFLKAIGASLSAIKFDFRNIDAWKCLISSISFR